MKKKYVVAAAIVSVLSGCGLSAALWLFNDTNRVNRDNFLRLKNGMTEAEVEEIFGARSQPWERINKGSYTIDDLEDRLWTGNGTAYVRFGRKNGLFGKTWIEEGFSSPTKGKFGEIRIGMTLADATAILGRAPDKVWFFSNNTTGAQWHDIDGGARLTFSRGNGERVTYVIWDADGAGETIGGRSLLEIKIRDLLCLE